MKLPSLAYFFVFSFIVFELGAQANEICGTNVPANQAMNIALQRSDNRCDQLDKDQIVHDYRHMMMSGELSTQCMQSANLAIQCCVQPENGKCGEIFSAPRFIASNSISEKVKSLIAVKLDAQNQSAIQAMACNKARLACSDNCVQDFNGQASVMCEKFVAFEHCEKKIANVYLQNACQTMVPLARSLAAEEPHSTVVCDEIQQALICHAE